MCHEIQIKTALGLKLQNCIKEKAFGVSRGTYLRLDLLQLTFVDVTALHGAKGVHLAAVPVAGCSALEHFGRDLRLCCLKKIGESGTRPDPRYGGLWPVWVWPMHSTPQLYRNPNSNVLQCVRSVFRSVFRVRVLIYFYAKYCVVWLFIRIYLAIAPPAESAVLSKYCCRWRILSRVHGAGSLRGGSLPQRSMACKWLCGIVWICPMDAINKQLRPTVPPSAEMCTASNLSGCCIFQQQQQL